MNQIDESMGVFNSLSPEGKRLFCYFELRFCESEEFAIRILDRISKGVKPSEDINIHIAKRLEGISIMKEFINDAIAKI